MFITTSVTAGVALSWGNKYLNRFIDDEIMLNELPKSRQWTEAGVFASLVEVVYRCDKREKDLAESLLKDLKYKRVPDIAPNIERLMVFERVGDGPRRDKVDGLRWPKYVVVMRGTIISDANDLSQDFQILLESLSPKTYKPVIDFLSELYGRTPGPDGVCVVGHSLGAAIALLATADLAIEQRIVLDTHLFNPPYFTLGALCKKVVKEIADGATNVLGIGDDWGRKIHDVAKWSITRMDKMARALGKELGPDTRAELTRRYNTLRSHGYRPDIYLNQHDPISNGYIEHFKRSSPRVSIAVLIGKNFVSHCASLHLIPLARVHTNHFAIGPKRAHDLVQWWGYEPVDLTSTNEEVDFCSSISDVRL